MLCNISPVEMGGVGLSLVVISFQLPEEKQWFDATKGTERPTGGYAATCMAEVLVSGSLLYQMSTCALKQAVELILLGHKKVSLKNRENPGCFGFPHCFSSILLSENIFAVSAVQGARALSKYPACKRNAVTLRLRKGEGGQIRKKRET